MDVEVYNSVQVLAFFGLVSSPYYYYYPMLSLILPYTTPYTTLYYHEVQNNSLTNIF